jgi:hypothetical protein
MVEKSTNEPPACHPLARWQVHHDDRMTLKTTPRSFLWRLSEEQREELGQLAGV